jgi:hypothetical protein
MQQFDFIVYDLRIPSGTVYEINHIGKDLIGMSIIIAYATYPQRSCLPQVLIVYLGNRDVKTAINLRGNGFNDLSLALQ